MNEINTRLLWPVEFWEHRIGSREGTMAPTEVCSQGALGSHTSPCPSRGVSSSRLVSLGALSLEIWWPLLSTGIPELMVVTLGSYLLTVAKEHTQSGSPVLSTLLPSQTLDWSAVKQKQEMLLNQSLPKMASAPGTQPGSPLSPPGAREESGWLCGSTS